MPVDRIIYKTPFHKEQQPQWLCPTCRRGVLEGIKGTFYYEESKPSKDAHSNDAWDPDWIGYTYSCSLRCTNPQCRDIVSSVGTGGVDYDLDYDDFTREPKGQRFYDYFQPKFFWPHLNIFNIPNKTPTEVKEEIEKSFELFFASPSSSSNQIRIALEKILDCLKINKYQIKNKKRTFISLHKRIALLPSAYNDIKELFFAIKWLGNSGSHGPNISIDDVMDAYDILEISLNELFEKKTKNIKKLAKQINRMRGPKKSKPASITISK